MELSYAPLNVWRKKKNIYSSYYGMGAILEWRPLFPLRAHARKTVYKWKVLHAGEWLNRNPAGICSSTISMEELPQEVDLYRCVIGKHTLICKLKIPADIALSRVSGDYHCLDGAHHSKNHLAEPFFEQRLGPKGGVPWGLALLPSNSIFISMT